MPELPEVEAVRRTLDPALRGARITRVVLRRAGLRRPFPESFVADLEGRRIERLERRGKYLLAALDSGATLVMHLGMSGSFRIERTRKRSPAAPHAAHDHVVFTLSNGNTVTFNDPRRFGVMDLVRAGSAVLPAALSGMGPEPLSPLFDAATLAAAVAGSRVALKVALLDQRIVAGLGNIYASEALHVARLSPKRRASTIATPSGRPRPQAATLVAAIAAVLNDAIARSEQPYRAGTFRVYDREGERCPTQQGRARRCAGTIRRVVQGGRSTFYCPVCQR